MRVCADQTGCASWAEPDSYSIEASARVFLEEDQNETITIDMGIKGVHCALSRGMPLEALRYDLTPTGLHYLLVHFDIPYLTAAGFRLRIGGALERPFELSLHDPGLLGEQPRERDLRRRAFVETAKETGQ